MSREGIYDIKEKKKKEREREKIGIFKLVFSATLKTNSLYRIMRIREMERNSFI